MLQPNDWKKEEQAHYEEELRRYNEFGKMIARDDGFITRIEEHLNGEDGEDVQPDHVVQQPKKDDGTPDEED